VLKHDFSRSHWKLAEESIYSSWCKKNLLYQRKTF